MKDFQDILKLIVEDETEEGDGTTGPGASTGKLDTFNKTNLQKSMTGNDPKEELKQWAIAHNKQYISFSTKIYNALKLFKEVYNALPDYDTSTVAKSMNLPAIAPVPDRSSALDAMKQQYMIHRNKFAKPAPANPGATGGV